MKYKFLLIGVVGASLAGSMVAGDRSQGAPVGASRGISNFLSTAFCPLEKVPNISGMNIVDALKLTYEVGVQQGFAALHGLWQAPLVGVIAGCALNYARSFDIAGNIMRASSSWHGKCAIALGVIGAEVVFYKLRGLGRFFSARRLNRDMYNIQARLVQDRLSAKMLAHVPKYKHITEQRPLSSLLLNQEIAAYKPVQGFEALDAALVRVKNKLVEEERVASSI